jgi:hypothetical protein
VLCRYDASGISDRQLHQIVNVGAGNYDAGTAMLNVARTMLQHAQQGMGALIATLHDVFKDYSIMVQHELLGPKVINGKSYQSPKYAFLATEKRVETTIHKAFETILMQRLRRVQDLWDANIRAMAAQMEVDMPVRFIMGYLGTPLEELVPEKERLTAPTIKDSVEYLAKHGKDLSSVPVAEIREGKGAKIKTVVRAPEPTDERENEKRMSLKLFRGFIRTAFQSAKGGGSAPEPVFNAADAATGGFQDAYMQELGNPNTTYLRNAGREYYYFAIFQVRTRRKLHNSPPASDGICDLFR